MSLAKSTLEQQLSFSEGVWRIGGVLQVLFVF